MNILNRRVQKYYSKGDKMLPGKKGISLTVDQYKSLKEAILEGTIDAAIQKLGGKV